LKEFSCSGGWDVTGLCWSRSGPDLCACDLTEVGEIDRVMAKFQPSAVVHCAAERRPEAVQSDPARARRLNVEVSGELAEACTKAGAWMVYISTDYVFDGTSPPYSTDDEPRPLNLYGMHKCEAEKLVLRDPGHSVLRVPLLFGPVEFLRESSVMELYASLLSGMRKADHRQRRYPTCAGDIARVLLAMAEAQRRGAAVLGVYHWQTDECLTKFDMVCAIAAIAGADASAVAPDVVVPAVPRPQDSRLDCSRLEALLGDPARFRTPFAEAMRAALAPWMIGAILSKASADSGRHISKETLVRVLLALSTAVTREEVERVFLLSDAQEGDRIDHAAFVRWIFQ